MQHQRPAGGYRPRTQRPDLERLLVQNQAECLGEVRTQHENLGAQVAGVALWSAQLVLLADPQVTQVQGIACKQTRIARAREVRQKFSIRISQETQDRPASTQQQSVAQTLAWLLIRKLAQTFHCHQELA